jgi:predicted DCC family thiol-disulfide oxidoreductase YuxK
MRTLRPMPLPSATAGPTPDSAPPVTAGPVMIYDGACGLCARGVQFILRHERDRTLRFAALDSAFCRAAFARPGAPALPPDTMAVIDGDRILFRSDAVLACATHLRRPWRAIRVFETLPRRWRDAAYDIVARRRLHWFGRAGDACLLPDATTRARFLA